MLIKFLIIKHQNSANFDTLYSCIFEHIVELKFFLKLFYSCLRMKLKKVESFFFGRTQFFNVRSLLYHGMKVKLKKYEFRHNYVGK